MSAETADQERASLDRYLLREFIFKLSRILCSSELGILDLCNLFGI